MSDIIFKRKPTSEEIDAATKYDLYLTHSCNFICRYCYLRSKDNKNISDDVINACVDHIDANHRNDNLVFLTFIGGEPLLEFEKIVYIVNKINRAHPLLRNKIFYNVVTNGSLLDTEKIKFMKCNLFYMVFSIDGAGDTQNHNRRAVNGSSTFERVKSNLVNALDVLNSIAVRITIHPKRVAFLANDIHYLMSLHCKNIGFVPAYEENWEFASMETFKEQMLGVLDFWEKELLSRTINLSPISFYLNELCSNGCVSRWYMHQCQLACGKRYSIDVDGNIYTCHRFVALKNSSNNFLMGNVFSGVNKNSEKRFYEDLKKLEHDQKHYKVCPALSHTLKCKGQDPILCYKNFGAIYKTVAQYFANNRIKYPNICTLIKVQ